MVRRAKHSELELELFTHLRIHLEIPGKFTNELIELNLPYLFARDQYSAINWLKFMESEYQISIPDGSADIFLLSSVKEMARLIRRLKRGSVSYVFR
jgi:hypothetical protein